MSSCSFDNTIEEISKCIADPYASELQSLLGKLGTDLRDIQNRAELTKVSNVLILLLNFLITKKLSVECEMQLYRVLANFVSDMPGNRNFLLNDYNGCKAFFQWSFDRLQSYDKIDSQLLFYICVFIYNFIIDEKSNQEPALYIDRFQYQSSKRNHTSWNILIDLCGRISDKDVVELLLNIMDTLSDIKEEDAIFEQLDTISIEKLLAFFDSEIQRGEKESACITLNVLENILNNKKLQLTHTHNLTQSLVEEMKHFSDESILTSLFNSVMLVSAVSATVDDGLSTYIGIWKVSKENDLLRSLSLILISNTIISDDSKVALMKTKDARNIFDDFFEQDYGHFSNDGKLKHLELQSTVLMNKLITCETALKWFNNDFLEHFLTDLSETCKETKFNTIFKNILLLNLKFLQRLLVSFQMHPEVDMSNDIYKTILAFTLNTGLFGILSVDITLQREIDMINFALIDSMALRKDGFDLSHTVDSVFDKATGRLSEKMGPIPLEYLMETFKSVALAISQDVKLIEREWFANFFRVANLAVSQKQSMPGLINNYKYICGIILNTDTVSSKELAEKYALI